MISGCEKATEVVQLEKDEPLFKKAQQFLKENRQNDAFSALSMLSEKRKDIDETHLELGRLYLDFQKDPIFAIYHFRQYLLKNPQGRLAETVLQLIETAKKEFARSLPFSNQQTESSEYLNLVEVLKQVRKENSELRNKLTSLMHNVSKTKSTDTTDKNKQTKAISSNIHTYTVETGDTLSKISAKVYGSAVKWKQIFEANKDKLPSPNSLKVGMELQIPQND